jgi:hypothetical protein
MSSRFGSNIPYGARTETQIDWVGGSSKKKNGGGGETGGSSNLSFF